MTSNETINAMNKVMFFMVNCGYDDVKKLIDKEKKIQEAIDSGEYYSIVASGKKGAYKDVTIKGVDGQWRLIATDVDGKRDVLDVFDEIHG